MILDNADFFISSNESEESVPDDVDKDDETCQWSAGDASLKINLGEW